MLTIVKDESNESDTVRVIHYEPGNCTRYTVMVSDLTDQQAQMMDWGENCVMVSIQNWPGEGFSSHPFNCDGAPIRVEEVGAMFHRNMADAAPLTKLLGYLLRRPTNVKLKTPLEEKFPGCALGFVDNDNG